MRSPSSQSPETGKGQEWTDWAKELLLHSSQASAGR